MTTKPKRRRARKRPANDTPDKRFETGRWGLPATVKEIPLNHRLVVTSMGNVRVRDNQPYRRGQVVEVFKEVETGVLYLKEGR